MSAYLPRDPLPIDTALGAIVDAVRTRRAAVVTAAPGAGKTTRVPPALAADGPVVLLQPRRVAARAIARRIADEQGWTVGREVGWHVRFDRRVSEATVLTVATEGVLTARLQDDPLLSDVRTLVLDEFHERSIHADLGLALARQAWRARGDLRLVVMSATLDAGRVAAFLDDCPVIDVPGRLFPVDLVYRPGVDVDVVVAEEVRRAGRGVLVFLPGAREIRQAAARVAGRLGDDVRVLPLHGGLDADAQDAALAPGTGPRVVLATNIAETTLTVPDVRVVVDAGQQKVVRHDADRGIDRLVTERVTGDAADQRAGRAGRVEAGRAVRLWDARDRLRPHREPDVARIDLSGVVLDVLAWGGDPRTLEWFDAPPAAGLDRAFELLGRLGAVGRTGRLTDLGRILQRLPLHPRLARLLLAAHAAPVAARACALLAEGASAPRPTGPSATSCDLLAAAERDLPPHVRRVASDIGRRAAAWLGRVARTSIDDEAFRRAVLAAWPDRVAWRREAGGDGLLLASGTGARLGRESGVVDGRFLVAVDVSAGPAGAIVRMATRVEREWLEPTSGDVEHLLDEASGTVRAVRRDRLGAIVLRETPAPADPAVSVRLLAAAWLRRGPGEADRHWLRRLAFAGHPVSDEGLAALVEAAAPAASRLDDLDLAAALPAEAAAALARHAPNDLPLPSGRRARLRYDEEGRVLAAVKLQELFGLAETPRLGPRRVPVTFELLAPNGRPVQVTSDLRSFWTSGYPEVRRQLRGRYPRHPWPEDPWTATPTHRTRRRES